MTLIRLEAVLDASGVPALIEALLPTGGRPRQLRAHALLLGLLLSQQDGRPAHLTRVHRALVTLDAHDRRRLGIEVEWKGGWHLLTYRQIERTFRTVVRALEKEQPDGAPSTALSSVLDALLEASVPEEIAQLSRSLAVDWSDHETFSCPPPKEGDCADNEASWGRRKSHQPGTKDEYFFGYELQAATMVSEERGPSVPELVRRMLLTNCRLDPPKEFVAVLQRMTKSGVTISDVLADSGYAHRVGAHWASAASTRRPDRHRLTPRRSRTARHSPRRRSLQRPALLSLNPRRAAPTRTSRARGDSRRDQRPRREECGARALQTRPRQRR